MMKLSVVVVTLLVLMQTAPPAVAASFLDTMRGLDISVMDGGSGTVSAPATPYHLGSYTLHDTDVNESWEVSQWRLRLPVYANNDITLGLQYGEHFRVGAVNSEISRKSIGMYASKELGRLQASMHLTTGPYTHADRVGPFSYSGNSDPALTWGATLRAKVWGLLGIQLSYEHTGQAVVRSHTYRAYDLVNVPLPPDYEEPPVTLGPVSSLYFGLSFNLGYLLPDQEAYQRKQAARVAAHVKKVVDRSLSSHYQAFVTAVATDIANQWGQGSLTAIDWREDEQALTLQMKAVAEYRQADIDAWLNERKDTTSVFPELQDGYLNQIVRLCSNQANQHENVPPRINLVAQFSGYYSSTAPGSVPIEHGKPAPAPSPSTEYRYYEYRGQLRFDPAAPGSVTLHHEAIREVTEDGDPV